MRVAQVWEPALPCWLFSQFLQHPRTGPPVLYLKAKGLRCHVTAALAGHPMLLMYFSGLQSSQLLPLHDIHCRKAFLLFLPSCLLLDLGFSGATLFRNWNLLQCWRQMLQITYRALKGCMLYFITASLFSASEICFVSAIANSFYFFAHFWVWRRSIDLQTLKLVCKIATHFLQVASKPIYRNFCLTLKPVNMRSVFSSSQMYWDLKIIRVEVIHQNGADHDKATWKNTQWSFSAKQEAYHGFRLI